MMNLRIKFGGNLAERQCRKGKREDGRKRNWLFWESANKVKETNAKNELKAHSKRADEREEKEREAWKEMLFNERQALPVVRRNCEDMRTSERISVQKQQRTKSRLERREGKRGMIGTEADVEQATLQLEKKGRQKIPTNLNVTFYCDNMKFWK
jgi:hypothetical protein